MIVNGFRRGGKGRDIAFVPTSIRAVSRWMPLLGVALIGVIVSCGTFVLVRNADKARVESVLDLQADWRARDFERKIRNAVEPIQALVVYVASEDEIDQGKFQRFARQVHAAEDPTRSLFWALRVTKDKRAEFENAVRAEGRREFRITDRNFGITEFGPAGPTETGGAASPVQAMVPAGERDEYFPVRFEERFEGGVELLGFDLLSEAKRRQAAFRARDEAGPVGTVPLPLKTLAGQGIGYQVYWPVYDGAEIPRTIEGRRSWLRGFVVGTFRLEAVIAAAIRGTPRIVETIRFFVNSRNTTASAFPVAAYSPETGAFQIGARPLEKPVPGGVRISRSFDVIGQHWVLVSDFSPQIVAGLRSTAPWAWLLTGLTLTALLALYLLREQRRLIDVEAVVADRTAELSAVNRSLGHEVEERKRIEETLQRSTDMLTATLEAAPFAIASLDPDQNVLIWNRAAERIFGYSAEEAIGRPYPLVSEEKRAEFDELFQRAAVGEVLRDVQVRHRRKDGQWLDISLSAAPLYDGGRLCAVVYALADITQANAVEMQLRQAQKMEAVGQLTGGLAHDFNNLLGIIIGNLDLLRERHKADPEADELSKDALEAALRGRDLTRRLLAFARRQPLRPERISVNDLVSGITKLLSRTLGENIEIKLDLAANVWPIMADAAQLDTAITNLANNARDAMPKGGRLTVTTRNGHLDADYAAQHPEVVPGDYAVIEVSDTGSGVPPEILGRIFEPFFTTKGLGKGTGLGLSMVFGFMKQSGGHINVYSEVGRGTTFRLYLPRADETARAAESDAAESWPARGGGETILVVEDNPKLRRVVVKQLTELGYRVLEAENARSALNVLESGGAIDLLFTDIVMPGETDGCALAREAILHRPGLRVLMTSGFPEARLTDSHVLAPGTRLLSKPYRKEELTRVVREVLEDQTMPAVPGTPPERG
jgi:PAS domain S-box-containing protein